MDFRVAALHAAQQKVQDLLAVGGDLVGAGLEGGHDAFLKVGNIFFQITGVLK